MRQKRAKTYRKLMALYSLTFGFRQPYQVLVDASFCAYSQQNKIEIEKQLATVLQGQVKPMITQCCITELYKMGSEHQATVDIAKQFERRKCNHREAIEGDECIKSVVGDSNKHRYAIATQSTLLREHLRTVPAVPIIHINRVVMVLEPPSNVTLRAKALAETSAQSATAPELAKVAAAAPAEPVPPPRKPKGPKGPNPLSMKKKKVKEPIPPQKKSKTDAKGKGKATDAPTPDPKVGSKRVRPVEDLDGEGHSGTAPAEGDVAVDIIGEDAEASARGGHRKKRRKRGGANKAPADGGEGED